jgi:hypothetical protein
MLVSNQRVGESIKTHRLVSDIDLGALFVLNWAEISNLLPWD